MAGVRESPRNPVANPGLLSRNCDGKGNTALTELQAFARSERLRMARDVQRGTDGVVF